MNLMHLLNTPLTEVSMSAHSLSKFAQSSATLGMLVGFEAELAVPVADSADIMQPDYSMDETADDFDHIVRFFVQGDRGISADRAQRLRTQLNRDFNVYINDLVHDRLHSDQEQSQIAELAEQDGVSQEDIQRMMQRRDLTYQKYSNQVALEITDDILSTVSEIDFLHHAGHPTMSEIEESYNLEWPHWQHSDRVPLSEIQSIAEDLEHALGVTVLASDVYHTAPRVSHAWVLEPDSSITVPRGGHFVGLELITPTPPLPVAEAVEMMNRVFDWAEYTGCETNSSTGFHISVSVPSGTTDGIDWIKLVLFLGDRYVLERFGRSMNTYAHSSMDALVTHLASEQFPVADALAAMRAGMLKLASAEMGRPHQSKYSSVNMRPGYVEFRSAGGDYLADRAAIQQTLLRYVWAISVAADPDAHKQEYARKLYKLMSASMPGGSKMTWVMDLFSLYNSGMITRSVLINSVRQHQRDAQSQR